MFKKIYSTTIALGLLVVQKVHAAPSLGFPDNFAGFQTTDIYAAIDSIVRIIAGFLGIITVLLILWGGIIWMSSFGDQDKIEKAKKLISAGVIGLVIVLASFAIASFVVNSLENAL